MQGSHDQHHNGRSPRTPAGSYLIVRNWKRHLHYSDRRAKWIKAYVGGDEDGRRGLDDDALTALPDSARLLFELFLKLAARMDNLVPYDTRRIGGWVSMRPQDVGKAIPRLLAEGYLEVVTNVRIEADGTLQLPLSFQADQPQSPSTTRSQPSDSVSTVVSQSLDNALTMEAASSNTATLSRDPASETLALTRAGSRAADAEQELDLDQRQKQSVPMPADRLPEQTPETVRRLAALACHGKTDADRERSARIIRYEAEGLPENLIARAAESYLTRRPRPRNPAGYVVNTLRELRAEAGLPDTRARIEREPDL